MAGRILNPDIAAMRPHDSMGNRQTHSRSHGFAIADVSITHRAKKLLEHSRPQLIANSRTLVFYEEKYRMWPCGGEYFAALSTSV